MGENWVRIRAPFIARFLFSKPTSTCYLRSMRGRLLVLIFGAILLAPPATSSAQQPGIPLLVGGGEELVEMRELDPALQEELEAETGISGLNLGYKYDYFSVFYFFELWTGEGQYVVYSGDSYIELSDDELQRITGESADEIGVPFRYRFPIGWWAAILAILYYAGRAFYRRRVLGEALLE